MFEVIIYPANFTGVGSASTSITECGLDSISVSIDGLRDSHNWLRCSESSYDHAIYAVELLSKASSKLTWDVITCINQRNISQLQDMLDEFVSHGVKRWKIFTVFPIFTPSNL